MTDTLQEERDGARRFIFKQIVHHVCHRDHTLIAHRDKQAQPNGMSLGDGQAIGSNAICYVNETVAVRTKERQSTLLRERKQVMLKLRSFHAHLAEA